jgi:hypothetical protein
MSSTGRMRPWAQDISRTSLEAVLDMLSTQALPNIRRQVAEGRAQGRIQGKVAIFRQLVRAGDLPIDGARVHVKQMLKAKQITSTLAREILASLG